MSDPVAFKCIIIVCDQNISIFQVVFHSINVLRKALELDIVFYGLILFARNFVVGNFSEVNSVSK